ncbi:TetR/AcrR family transcriptional regulator C-terminal domain-containing protein [Corynebacterium glutamicum]|uniref:TetR/AcrR family transcriptional regulator C-terminal domain-containing protein n=1 Tax=Corynebacterium glutamicum TaxID=1718 RepID=UPI001B8BCA31|nr:TetR/AcrR family transcriptional regulator C-terminal domain-containing protein [Corynebacterium glutamicum]
MAPSDSVKRAPRNTINREILVEKAIQIADEVGLAGFSIRVLADSLGVKPMAVYTHVKNKDELLTLIVDQVFASIYAPQPGENWKAELTRAANSKRAALLQHPWALAVMESRRDPGPYSMKHHEAVLATIKASGASLGAIAHGYALFDAYIFGFVYQEIMLSHIGLDEETEEVAEGLDLAEFPTMAELVEHHALAPGYQFSHSWQPGLDTVLTGIKRFSQQF